MSFIMLSGDGDFDLLLQKDSEIYGCNTQVYGVPQLTATSLVNAADEFFKIETDLLQ
jgi:uncharacterized LabA/DUF88 family protein